MLDWRASHGTGGWGLGKYQIALRRGDLLEISDEIRVRDLLDISDAKGTIINIRWARRKGTVRNIMGLGSRVMLEISDGIRSK